MQMVDNLKQIVEYVCENFEDLDMDDPVEEGYLSLSHDFWNLEDRVLKVYPDIESLKEKDAYLAECCESSLSEKPYEFLDI